MIPVEVTISNHHVHLLQEDLETLFGKGYELTVKKPLGHTEFAANETVTVQGPKGSISGFRVLGPVRPYTQAELLRSDVFSLGVNPPVAESVNECEPCTLTLTGPAGSVTKECGIIASRHIHISKYDVAKFNVQNHSKVSVKTEGERGLVFNNVNIKFMAPDVEIASVMHVDMDEANAAGINSGDTVYILD